ncbi:hypothetical protein DITRI_Ditri07aG0126600 [Diplodiscus trichospermus]
MTSIPVIQNDKWEKPTDGWVKFNCDGSFRSSTGIAGFAVLVRNQEGRMIEGSHGIFETNSALVTEAWSLREGTKLAVKKNFQNAVFQTDSSSVFSAVNSNEAKKDWCIEPIVRDIRPFLKSVPEKNVRLIIGMLTKQQIGLLPKPP